MILYVQFQCAILRISFYFVIRMVKKYSSTSYQRKEKEFTRKISYVELILYLIFISKINFSVFHSTLSSSINVEY